MRQVRGPKLLKPKLAPKPFLKLPKKATGGKVAKKQNPKLNSPPAASILN
jgi:hypothetical protein